MPAQATVRIYNDDGSVEVNVSGCEIGQGLYTKVAQSVAYKLGIDVSLVNVVPTRSDATPVIFYTGGSFGSEMSCGVRDGLVVSVPACFPNAFFPCLARVGCPGCM
jgi:xanthine dehydrogenase molybdopterin-binding subunit B